MISKVNDRRSYYNLRSYFANAAVPSHVGLVVSLVCRRLCLHLRNEIRKQSQHLAIEAPSRFHEIIVHWTSLKVQIVRII